MLSSAGGVVDLDCGGGDEGGDGGADGGGDEGGDGGADGGGSPRGPEGGSPTSSEWGSPSEKGASLKSSWARTTRCSREGVGTNSSSRGLSLGGKRFGAVSCTTR